MSKKLAYSGLIGRVNEVEITFAQRLAGAGSAGNLCRDSSAGRRIMLAKPRFTLSRYLVLYLVPIQEALTLPFC